MTRYVFKMPDLGEGTVECGEEVGWRVGRRFGRPSTAERTCAAAHGRVDDQVEDDRGE